MKNDKLREIQCEDCINKNLCDIYLENGNVDFGHPCSGKTWKNKNGETESNFTREMNGLSPVLDLRDLK